MGEAIGRTEARKLAVKEETRKGVSLAITITSETTISSATIVRLASKMPNKVKGSQRRVKAVVRIAITAIPIKTADKIATRTGITVIRTTGTKIVIKAVSRLIRITVKHKRITITKKLQLFVTRPLKRRKPVAHKPPVLNQ